MVASASIVQRLYLMQVAALPPGDFPVVCYLVQTIDGRNILIDSGLPDKADLPPGFEPTLGENVIEQLALLGLRPGNIDVLICTHFDIDHAGHHNAFVDADAVVQKSHYDNALTHPRFANTRPYWKEFHFRFVEGDVEFCTGLELIRTDGHTLGHQSVLVRLSETGVVLLTVDAVGDQNSFQADREIHPFDEDPEAVRASTLKLLDLANREQCNLVIFGHDRAQWEMLKKLPEYYS